MRKTCREAEAGQIDDLKKFGMEVTVPDKAKFKALMKPAYDRMKTITGEDNLIAFMKIVDEVGK